MAIAYLGLGSNLDGPAQQLRNACAALTRLAETEALSVSGFYRNAPMGPAEQPDYVNAVARLVTGLDPLTLLDALQAIEAAQGRVRGGERWGPRTLDLDLLLYGELVMHHERLVLPHPGLSERSFVVLPLAEVAPPDLIIPGAGTLADLRIRFPANALMLLEHADE